MAVNNDQPAGGKSGRTKGLIYAALILIGSITAGVLIGYLFSGFKMGGIAEVVQPPFGGKRKVTILMLGEDNTGSSKSRPNGLSDTMMLTSFDFDNNTVAALSIPRDTRVELPGKGNQKINSALVKGGPIASVDAVEKLIGFRPDYYLMTNLEGFKETVDAVGGVEIDVEKDMHYVDHYGGLYINLKKGLQVLNGEKAMEYVRFRHDKLGDLTRIQRQQKFMKALAKKAIEPENLPQLPSVIQVALKNVKTDMTPKDAVFLTEFVGKLDSNQIVMDTLPGAPQYFGNISFWVADPEKTTIVVKKLFIDPIITLPSVVVLNGSGQKGAAQAVADLLTQEGYKIVAVGNAYSNKYDVSEVICHKEGLNQLDKLTGLLNISTVKQEEPKVKLKSDVTVIVGKDWLNGQQTSKKIGMEENSKQ